MPRLTIRGQGGELVWEGEGELHLDSSPESAGLPTRIANRQEEARPTERRCRELDLTTFLREVPSDYTIQYLVPDLVWDPDADPLTIPEPPRLDRMVLNIDFPAEALGWLADVLSQSFETPEERRVRHEEFESRMRRLGNGSLARGIMQSMAPDFQRAALAMENLRAQAEAVSGQRITLADLLAGGAAAEAVQGGHAVDVQQYEDGSLEFSSGMARSSMARLRDRYRQAPRLSEEEIRRIYNNMVMTPEDWRAQIGAAGDFGDTFPDVLERIQARSAEHEEAITSARSEFPYDPLGYGRIYPGDAGTSRWTPPEDPDEKIRSCP